MQLIGVELILLRTHVLLLQPFEPLLFGLLGEELMVLFLVLHLPLLSKHAAEQAVVVLLRIGQPLLPSAMICQLYLPLQCISHLYFPALPL